MRKEILSRLTFYGVDEEDGERNQLRKYLFHKYREMVRNLKARLIKERLTLIKLDKLMSGGSASNSFQLDVQNDAVNKHTRPVGRINPIGAKAEVEFQRNRQERSKFPDHDYEAFHERGSNSNSMAVSGINMRRMPGSGPRPGHESFRDNTDLNPLRLSSRGSRGELDSFQHEEAKEFSRTGRVSKDILERPSGHPGAGLSKRGEAYYNFDSRSPEGAIQPQSAGLKQGQFSGSKFQEANSKLGKAEVENDSQKKYNLRHKIEDGDPNSGLKLKKIVYGNHIF